MSKIENVKVGEHIVIIDDAYHGPISLNYNEQVEPALAPKTGVPLAVRAIGCPFILCETIASKPKSTAIDCRYVTWTKVSKKYVQAYCKLNQIDPPKGVTKAAEPTESKTKKCPLCSRVMHEQLKTKQKEWIFTCQPCKVQLVKV